MRTRSKRKAAKQLTKDMDIVEPTEQLCEEIDEDEKLKYEFYAWNDKPFTHESVCSLDPYYDIKDLRNKLNHTIFFLENLFPFLRVRNLVEVDAFYALKKNCLKLPQQSWSTQQAIIMNNISLIEETVKEIGDNMRKLHSLLLEGGFIVKPTRQKRKRSKSKATQSTFDMLNVPVPEFIVPIPSLDSIIPQEPDPIQDMEIDHDSNYDSDDEDNFFSPYVQEKLSSLY